MQAISGSDPSGADGGKFADGKDKGGIFAWPIKWQVTGNSDSGVILQRVHVTWDVKSERKVKGQAVWEPIRPASFPPRFYFDDWYEAWIVTRGADGKNTITPAGAPKADVLDVLKAAGVKLPKAQDIGKMNDWFFVTQESRFGRTTRGSIKFSADAIFYEGMTQAQLTKQGFENQAGVTGAGKLLSYQTKTPQNRQSMEKFLAGYKVTSETLHRELMASWDPEKDGGKTKVEATKKP